MRDLIRDFALQRQSSLSLLVALGKDELRREALRPTGEVLTIPSLAEA